MARRRRRQRWRPVAAPRSACCAPGTREGIGGVISVTMRWRPPREPAPVQERIMTIERRHVGKRMSQLVIHRASGTAYLAGQVAADPKADISGQTQAGARADRCSARRSRHGQGAAPVGDDLSAGHRRFRGDERRLGPVGRRGRDAGARHRRGSARGPRVQGRDPGGRCDRGIEHERASAIRHAAPLASSAKEVIAATSRREVIRPPQATPRRCPSRARRSIS